MTNSIVRGRHDSENPYYVASRATAQNVNLSYEALGLLTYLLSKPDDWEVQIDDLIRPDCGRDKVYRIVAELKAAGYMTREKKRNAKGQWEWEPYRLYEQPQTISPDAGAPDTEYPDVDQPDTGNPEIKALNTESDRLENDKDDDDTACARVFTAYHDNIGTLTGMIGEDLKTHIQDCGVEWVIDAIREAARHNGRSMAYVSKILLTWQQRGRQSDAPATPKNTGPLPRRGQPPPPVIGRPANYTPPPAVLLGKRAPAASGGAK